MTSAPTSNPTIDWESTNLQGEWTKFAQHVNLMFKGPMSKSKADEKAAYLLIWVGPTGRDIFNSWNLKEPDNTNFDTILEKFNQYASPKKNSVFARYVFNERKQHDGETFEAFVTDLRNLVKPCTYKDPDEMVRDKIVGGIRSQAIREKLLMEGDTLTMQKAIDIAITFETTQHHLQSMATGNTEKQNVDSLRKGFNRFKIKCRNCGTDHEPKRCPAYGTTCRLCGKQNH